MSTEFEKVVVIPNGDFDSYIKNKYGNYSFGKVSENGNLTERVEILVDGKCVGELVRIKS